MDNFVCFCGNPAKSFKNKNGVTFFTCGTKMDFKRLSDIYKMKVNEGRDEALKQVDLGCNMRLNENEISFIQNQLKETPGRRNFLKCQHDLIAKLGISSSETNNGKLFYTCNVKFPDRPCKFFHWYDAPLPVCVKRKQDEDEKANQSKKLKFSRWAIMNLRKLQFVQH